MKFNSIRFDRFTYKKEKTLNTRVWAHRWTRHTHDLGGARGFGFPYAGLRLVKLRLCECHWVKARGFARLRFGRMDVH